jgi:hypothetical protein
MTTPTSAGGARVTDMSTRMLETAPPKLTPPNGRCQRRDSGRLTGRINLVPVKPQRSPECERRELRHRDASSIARLFQRLQRRVETLGRQLKCPEMNADAVGSGEVDVRLNGLRRIHMDASHEPARLVRANRNQRQVNRSQTLPDGLKERPIRGITGEEDSHTAQGKHESTPKSAIPIERSTRREMMCWRQGYRRTCRLHALPSSRRHHPAQGFDAMVRRRGPATVFAVPVTFVAPPTAGGGGGRLD